jgi:hypothetical protein
VQVLLAMIAAVALGYWRPERFAYQCDLLDDRDHSCGKDGVGQARPFPALIKMIDNGMATLVLEH